MKHPIDDRADVGAPGGAEDPRSTAELVDIYVDDPESDEAIDVLAVLHERGGEEESRVGVHAQRAAHRPEHRQVEDRVRGRDA